MHIIERKAYTSSFTRNFKLKHAVKGECTHKRTWIESEWAVCAIPKLSAPLWKILETLSKTREDM